MEKQFVPYELALKLKELGFDEKCLMFYMDNETLNNCKLEYIKNSSPSVVVTKCTAAPMWQQAFDWFLNVHHLYVIIIPTITMNWTFKTITVIQDVIEVPPYSHVDANDYSTYEEARQFCLEKLIELSQQPPLTGHKK